MDTSNTVEEDTDRLIPPENDHEGGAKLAESMDELYNLSIAIQTFKSRYDELQKHLDFIEQSIDTRTKELEALSTSTAQKTTDNGEMVRPEPESKPVSKAIGQESESKPVSQAIRQESESKPKSKADGEGEVKDENDPLWLCKDMNGRGLRKHILTHLSEATSLKEQIPVALKIAPNPSKLVFECIGRFYLQGIKAYTKGSPMVTARQASVLILEYYLLSGCVASGEQVEPSLKEEAAAAAVAWRKRLIVEGGVANAGNVDARGLILFVACFGIPDAFRNEDITNLYRLSNPGEILPALRQSQVLLRRVPDIAEGIKKKGMVVEAVDLAYSFGFEEKLSPQTVLTSFLQKSNEAWKKAKQEAHDVPSLLKKANEKYLTALKSVVDCLEGHKVDFVKLLPGWQLKDKILLLEKDISEVTKKIENNLAAKRKLDKSNTSKKVKNPEAKRTRFTGNDYSVASPSVTSLQEQRIASYMDGNSSYDSSLATHLMDGRLFGHLNNYPTAASTQIGSLSTGGDMLGGARASSFSGYQGDMTLDNVGTTPNSKTYGYGRNGIGEEALSYDRSVGQSFVAQPLSVRVHNLYGKASKEGFTGLADHLSVGVSGRSGGGPAGLTDHLSVGVSVHSGGGPVGLPDHLSNGISSQGGGSDLYSFADAVFDV